MCGQSSIPDSFLSEGRGMAEAFAADLVAAGFTVERMIDESICHQHPPPAHGLTYHRIRASEEEKPLFEKLADAADYTVVIAPETKGSLAERVQWAVKSKGKLLGPCQNLIELTADKHRLALHLSARGIPVPPGVAVPAGNSLPVDFEYPAVLKERDGAGSQQMQYLRHADPDWKRMWMGRQSAWASSVAPVESPPYLRADRTYRKMVNSPTVADRFRSVINFRVEENLLQSGRCLHVVSSAAIWESI